MRTFLRAAVLAWFCSAASIASAAGDGTVLGQVFDGETGAPVPGVTVTVTPSPAPAAGHPPDVEVTNRTGAYRFPSLAAGTYDIRFEKRGYRDSVLSRFVVQPDKLNRADFPLSPLPKEQAEGDSEIEEFVVVGSSVDLSSLELRVDSDELLNILSAEELAKFAAGDVAEALNRMAGVNVVEGQFAIIRGLEDRYSSTLYNGGAIPSPDPDSQSVQLDLFPSEIVSNLVVAKSFGAEMPSNSSGGSIDIVTHDYPEEFELRVNLGSGWNQNAWDEFVDYRSGSPIGHPVDGSETLESEYGFSVGGRRELAGRELRWKGVMNQEVDYETAEGEQESLEPRPPVRASATVVTEPGDLSLGELNLSGGAYDLVESERSEQTTGYFGFGLDLDTSGNHRLDGSYFTTRKKEDTVQDKGQGHIPGFDYGQLATIQEENEAVEPFLFNGYATRTAWIARSIRDGPMEPATRGPIFFASMAESDSFRRDRDLTLYQVNGDHYPASLEGLHLDWVASHSSTNQDENSLGVRYFFEPQDLDDVPSSYPTTVDDLSPGGFAANSGIFLSTNDVREKQNFARFGADYRTPLLDLPVELQISLGGWWEDADRDVGASYLESPTIEGNSQFIVVAPTAEQLGDGLYDDLGRDTEGQLSGLRDTENEASREVFAWSLGTKATLWHDLDLLAGFRWEDLRIESRNDAFTGLVALDGTPDVFPTKYLFFDRLDNPARGEFVPSTPTVIYNDEILGLAVPVDPATGLVDLADRAAIQAQLDGEIDEQHVLPALGFTYRPIEGLNLRGAWSRTVARPSFREMGYYVSVEPGSDDLIVGNPQMQLSDVESWDLRAEYVYGDFGDLAAVSGFLKSIQDPIESLVVRNPLNAEGSSSALYRTFFNNPNEASLWGVELEARKNLGFFGPELTEYFTVGANYTYIVAEVDRTDAELARSELFFGVPAGSGARFDELEKTRRLFGQPEWIANADITFDHPDWGTRLTLALFAISDVLDAAGTAAINNRGNVVSVTLDRYIDSYHQLDLILSKTWQLPRSDGDVTLKLSAKNLTDSRRRIIYDPDQTRSKIEERSFRVGRDYAFSITYSF